jgi:hypothetical protein
MTELINKYKNGKVYKIEPIVDHDEEDIYIGSTCQPYLSSRMNQHRQDYDKFKQNKKKSNVRVYNLFDKYGIENCNIILIESVEANNKMELHQREAYFIRTLKCINKCIPLRTDKEWRETNKEILKEKKKIIGSKYYENNKDKIKEKCKEWRETNKEKLKEKNKQYSENNKDKLNEKAKKYYELNKDKVLNYQKKYHGDNKDKINTRCKEWREANKDKIKDTYESNKELKNLRRKELREINKDKINARNRELYKLRQLKKQQEQII